MTDFSHSTPLATSEKYSKCMIPLRIEGLLPTDPTQDSYGQISVQTIIDAASNPAAASATAAAQQAGIATTQALVATAQAATVTLQASLVAAAMNSSSAPYANAAATYLPQGVVALNLTSGGSGGSNGINILATYSGGTLQQNPVIRFDIVAGAVTNVRLVSPGLYIGSGTPTMPTVIFPGAAGSPAITLTAGVIVNPGQTYWVASADSSQILLYGNNGGSVATAPFGGTQVAMYAKAGVDGAVANVAGLYGLPYNFTQQSGTFESGKYYSASTGLGVISSTRDSRTISCNGGDWFLATGQVLGTDMALVTFLDAGGARINANVNVGTATATAYNRFLFQAPANARTLRVSGMNNGGWPVVIESATSNPLLGDSFAKLLANLQGYYSPTFTWTAGQYWSNAATPALAASGTRQAASSIALSGGEQVRVNVSIVGAATSAIIWTDAYGKRISSVGDGNADNVTVTNFTNANGNNVFTAPANARGMLVTHYTSGGVSSPTIEIFGIQSGVLQLLNAAITANTTNIATNTANIAANAAQLAGLQDWYSPSGTTLETGVFYNYLTGAVTSNASRNTLRVPVTPGQTMRVSTTVSGTAMAEVVFVRADGTTYVGYRNQGTGSSVVYTNDSFTVPANAGYALIGGLSVTPTAQLYGIAPGLTAALNAAIATNTANIATNTSDLNNLRGYYTATTTLEAGFYYNYSTGAKTANASRNTLRLSVTPGQQLRVNTQIIGTVTAEVVYLKADGSYLSYRNQASSNSVSDTYTNDVFTVPANAATALVCCVDTVPTVEIYGVPPISAPAISRMASVNDRWTGKRILWMGNSIPAGLTTLVGGAKGNYPAQIADLLGATVINNAIGQGIWRAGYAPRASSGGSDPLGIGGGNWVTYGRRFSASLAEMQDYVNNWGSKWQALMASDVGGLGAPPATLTAAQQANFLSSSYENWLDPYLATTDLFVLDNPRNDVGFDYGLTSNGIMDAPVADGRDPRVWYRGAMDFLITRILNYNPRANIMLFGHHETDVGPYIWQAQMLVAGGTPGWSLPICKTWEKTGFSSNVITNGGTTQAERLFSLPDGIHPHSDTTGKSLRMIAQIGASFIRDLPL